MSNMQEAKAWCLKLFCISDRKIYDTDPNSTIYGWLDFKIRKCKCHVSLLLLLFRERARRERMLRLLIHHENPRGSSCKLCTPSIRPSTSARRVPTAGCVKSCWLSLLFLILSSAQNPLSKSYSSLSMRLLAAFSAIYARRPSEICVWGFFSSDYTATDACISKNQCHRGGSIFPTKKTSANIYVCSSSKLLDHRRHSQTCKLRNSFGYHVTSSPICSLESFSPLRDCP